MVRSNKFTKSEINKSNARADITSEREFSSEFFLAPIDTVGTHTAAENSELKFRLQSVYPFAEFPFEI